MKTESCPIRIQNPDGVGGEGVLFSTVYSDKERMFRAAKLWAVLWFLAGVTLFIPIVHFVLVPGFLIAGPIMGWLRFRVIESTDYASGRCPTCQQEMKIMLESSDRLPLWTYCSVYNDPVELLYSPSSDTGQKNLDGDV